MPSWFPEHYFMYVFAFPAYFLKLYEYRIRAASKELANSSEVTLDSLLQSMTPEWLTSLLLDNESNVSSLTAKMRQKLTKHPDECLELLKVGSQITIINLAREGARL